MVLHLVPRNSDEPRRQSSVPPIPLQAAPGFQKHILHEVLDRIVSRGKTPIDVRIHRVSEARDELGGGFAVFAKDRGNQLLFFARLDCPLRTWSSGIQNLRPYTH